ncbi:MAG: TetR/AcrR family transcriptional regulator, partial [Coriobacteriales bacterium]|nr:TetR/AcrR family transcriptional regulator [Coriobacteriales bacterium]
MDNSSVSLGFSQDESSTRERIAKCAADLFASKGYTETSIREIADAVKLNAASLYYHFPSKNAILEYMLKDYMEQVWGSIRDPIALQELHNNPTPEGIMDCMKLSFPEDKVSYYIKVLSVLLQEHHRNPTIRKYVIKNFLDNEAYVETVFKILQEANVIRQDANPDFWMKAASSLLYAYSNRMMLGIGDDSPDYTGMDMVAMLH